MIRTPRKPINVLLAESHEIFRDGFRTMIAKTPSINLIGEAFNERELIAKTKRLKPDIIFADVGIASIEITRSLVKLYPGLGIIALSMSADAVSILGYLDAGATGYILKNASVDEILKAVRSVHKKETYYCTSTSKCLATLIGRHATQTEQTPQVKLNEKETRISQLICGQFSNIEIADQMGLSKRTIEGYREIILEKVKAKNTVGLVIYAIKNNIYQREK